MLERVRTRSIVLCVAALLCGCQSPGVQQAQGTDTAAHNGKATISSAAVSPDGKLIAISVFHTAGGRAASAGLWVVDSATGRTVAVFEPPDTELRSPSWSTDSKRVAVTYYSRDASGVKVLDLESRRLRDVVGPEEGIYHFGPAMSPDGKWVAYVRVRRGIPSVCVAHVDGQSPLSNLVAGEAFDDVGSLSLSWSADSDRLYYLSPSDGEARAAAVTTGEDARVGTLPAKGFSGRTAPSPDGRWLLCTAWAAEEEADGAWLMSVADGEVTALPSTSPGPRAAWSPTGSHVVWGEAGSEPSSGLFVYDVASGSGERLTGPGERDTVAGPHAWNEDDRVFFIRDRSAVMSVSGRDGTRVKLPDADVIWEPVVVESEAEPPPPPDP